MSLFHFKQFFFPETRFHDNSVYVNSNILILFLSCCLLAETIDYNYFPSSITDEFEIIVKILYGISVSIVVQITKSIVQTLCKCTFPMCIFSCQMEI